LPCTPDVVVLSRCARGVAYAELIVAFMPLFLLFLCTIQLAFMAQASLVVRHAAVVAARKAVVVLDDDPAHYDGAPRASLHGEERNTAVRFGFSVLQLLAGSEASGDWVNTDEDRQGGARLSAIREAAYVPLAAAAPAIEHMGVALRGLLKRSRTDSVASSIGRTPWARVLGGYALFAPASAALTFPVSPMSTRLRPADQPFAVREPVTTRITMLWPCTVPIARVLLCKSFLQQLALAPEDTAAIRTAAARSPAALAERIGQLRAGVQSNAAWLAQLLTEAEQAEYPWLWLAYLIATDERFVVLRAEATLPNQGAPYRYASELNAKDSESAQ
jgi:hypothetical protein